MRYPFALLTSIGLLLSLAPAAPAATYFVAPDGSGDHATIQQAIDAASDSLSIPFIPASPYTLLE